MATKKAVATLEGPMMLIAFGWGASMILPWDDGVAFMATLKDAHFVKSEYKDGSTQWFLNSKAEFSAAMFTPAQQAQVLMNGTGGVS